MIEIRNERPRNRGHFSRLIEFCKEVAAVCEDLGIEPWLFAYRGWKMRCLLEGAGA